MKDTWLNIIKGDRASFLKLYDTYYTPLFHYGMTIRRDRELVKESLHILFCELWERHERLPQTTMDPKFYLFTWLKRIIIRQVEVPHSQIEDLLHEPAEDSIEAQRIAIEQVIDMHERLQRALDKLTKKQRRYIQWRFFEERSYEEIAELDNASVRTVYNVIYEALKRLRGDIAILQAIILIFSK